MPESVVVKLKLEIEKIDRLLESFADLFQRARSGVPNLVETAALALIVQSFYTGLERIFLFIADGIDGHQPVGARWHQELLDQMGGKTPKRGPVVSPALVERLDPYLDFRHFSRHGYSYDLDWEKMVDLVVELEEIWSRGQQELAVFIRGLETTE